MDSGGGDAGEVKKSVQWGQVGSGSGLNPLMNLFQGFDGILNGFHLLGSGQSGHPYSFGEASLFGGGGDDGGDGGRAGEGETSGARVKVFRTVVHHQQTWRH